ncbi:MAG: arsenate reductase-like glutaredoxin family protein [Lentimonas sp.]|jgi:arsenate reductase-like glutaredoxin family protein
MEKTSIIKRPIIDDGRNQIIGFNLEEYEKLLIS